MSFWRIISGIQLASENVQELHIYGKEKYIENVLRFINNFSLLNLSTAETECWHLLGVIIVCDTCDKLKETLILYGSMSERARCF